MMMMMMMMMMMTMMMMVIVVDNLVCWAGIKRYLSYLQTERKKV